MGKLDTSAEFQNKCDVSTFLCFSLKYGSISTLYKLIYRLFGEAQQLCAAAVDPACNKLMHQLQLKKKRKIRYW